jgi:adenylate kinase
LAQAEALEATLGSEGLAMCLNIDVPTELVAERLSQRRICQECNTIYTASDPAAVSGTCEKCGGDVIQRADDTAKAITQRLHAYERDTAPLLDFYAQRGLLETVNGNQSVKDVSAAIDAAIQRRGLV